MINVNEKLLDQLDADQYFLISKIVKYGKKSCPKNDVLKSATGWGIKKVQRVKKELIALDLLVSTERWKYVDGKRMRDSNQYTITTNLIAKYRGKNNDPHIGQIGMVEIGTDEDGLVQFGLDEFELDEKGTGIKVLRIIIIDNNKLLKLKGSIEREKEPTLEIKSLKSELQKAQAQILELKNQKEPKEKSSAKKEKGHTFPDITPLKKYETDTPKTESETDKPYQMFLNNYPFNGWSEKLKENFILYCEVKHDYNNGRYSTTQIKMRIAEITAGIEKHEFSWLEKLVLSAANGSNGGWVDFQFDKRIRERKLKQKQDEQKQSANNGKSLYENYADMLNKDLYGDGNKDTDDTVDTSWADA